MSRKIRKVVASTLALAMMAGTVSSMPAGQFSVIINAATADQVITKTDAAGVAGPVIDAGKYEVKPGEEFTVKVKVAENSGDGFGAINAWLDVDTNVFDIVSCEPGDVDDPDNEFSIVANNTSIKEYSKPGAAAGLKTLIIIFNDTNNNTGTDVLATIKLKAKADAKEDYYSLPFDAHKADGAVATRVVTENGERTAKPIDATFKGASITVGTPSGNPTVQPPASETTTPPSQPTSNTGNEQTGSLTAKVANATGSAGSTVKTTLDVSGSVAGFTAELSYDKNALELTGATASGWDVKVEGGKIVALANPYQDNSSASVNLEFKASASASGSYDVKVSSIEGATKGEKEIKGTGTAGTIQISGSTTPTTVPTSQTPQGNGIRIRIGDVSDAKAGSTVTVPIYAENVGEGLSTVQFDYKMDDSLKVQMVAKGDFDCQWTVGTEEKSLQFLEKDGNNITKDGLIGKMRVVIPEGASGAYPIEISGFEGSVYSATEKKQLSLAASAFSGVKGTIYVGVSAPETSDPGTTTTTPPASTTTPPASTSNPPSDPTNSTSSGISIKIGEVTGAKAGSTVTVPIYAENVGAGLSTVQFDYDMDASFKVQMVAKGDFDCQWTVGTEERSLQFLEKDGNNISKDGMIGKMRVVIPEGAADGTYDIKISNFEGSVYSAADKKQLPLTASAFTGVAGKIVIGEEAGTSTTTPPVSTSTPPSTPTSNPPADIPTVVPTQNTQSGTQQEASSEIGEKVSITFDGGKYTANAGDEITVKIKVTENDSVGYAAVNAWLDVDTSVFEIGDVVGGDADDEENEFSLAYNNTSVKEYQKPGAPDTLKTLVIIYNNTDNSTEKGVFATLKLKVKAGVSDGFYALPFDMHKADGATATRVVTVDGERTAKPIAPKFVGGLVQVGNPSTPPASTTTPPASTTTPPTSTTTPPSDPTAPVGDGITIRIGEVTDAKAGSTVTVPIYAENIGAGISTVQFDYKMDESFKVQMVAKGDFDCQWTVGTEERSLQFLEKDGNNITKDGLIGKMRVVIPEGAADGVYPIEISGFEGSVYSAADKKQLPLDASAFKGAAGKIVIGDGNVTATVTPPVETTTPPSTPTTPPTSTATPPSDPTNAVTDAIKIKLEDVKGVKAGTTITVPLYAENVGNGFSTVQFDYDMDPSFKVQMVAKGDFDCQWTVGTEERSLQFLEKDGNNITKDGMIGKIRVVIPEGAADGEYEIKLSGFSGSVYDATQKKQLPLDGKAFEGVSAKIVIGDGPTTPPTEPTTTPDDSSYDVNGDGVVTTADIVSLKQYLLLAADKSTVPNGDINKDGKITSQDMIHLVKYFINK